MKFGAVIVVPGSKLLYGKLNVLIESPSVNYC